jgi:large subunit ribosomal protein L10
LGLSVEEKKALVAEIGAMVARAGAMVLAEYRSLEVSDITRLRAKARQSGVTLRVLKNTLARRAVSETPFAGLAQHMKGPLVYGISADPVAAAKVLQEFAKSNEKFVITAGALPNQVMTSKEVAVLASMPGRQELLGKLVATMQAPLAKLARTLNEVPSKFVRTLAAVRDAKERAPA